MHVAGLIELAHCRVDQWIACTRLAPGLEMPRRIRPRQRIVLWLESVARRDVGTMPEDLVVEVAPDQLGQPGLRPMSTLLPGRRGKLADGHRAEAQVCRQIRRSLACRKIARGLITVDPLQEIPEQLRAARHACREPELAQIGGDEPYFPQGGNRCRQC